ncbi:MAG: four helix bundle protein [Candidatus Omnitrophota bacterium]
MPSNIAEGYARQHKLEYRQFLSLAYGSLAELETQAMLAKDLTYIKSERDTALKNLIKEAGSILYRMLNPIR